MAAEPKDKSLTEEEKSRASAWVTSHWTQSRACPVCGSNNWTLSPHIVQPITHLPLAHPAPLGGGIAYPALLVTCLTCAYTLHFNAVVMGLLPQAKEAKDRAEGGEEAKAPEVTNGQN